MEMEKFGGCASTALLYCIIQIDTKSNEIEISKNKNRVKNRIAIFTSCFFTLQPCHRQNCFHSTAGCSFFRGVPPLA